MALFEEYLQEEDPQEELPQEEPSEEKSFFGFSRVEAGIMVALLVVICGLVIFVGISFIRGFLAARDAGSQLPSTITPLPSPTPVLTATPWPEAAPIAGWNKFEFAESTAYLWLPNTFQGGDPVAFAEIVMMTVETYSNDEVFNQSVENILIDHPGLRFFGFDVEAIESARVVFVAPEQVHLDPQLTMEDYLDEYNAIVLADGDRLVGQEVVVLDHFEAGRLIVEFKVPVGDDEQYMYGKMVIYLVQVGDTIWSIAYRTNRDDFPDYWPVIQESINTFRVYP